MAGEHPIPGHEHLQRLPHPPPVGPYSCTLLTEVSQGGQWSQGLCFLAWEALLNLVIRQWGPGWVALCSACVSLPIPCLTSLLVICLPPMILQIQGPLVILREDGSSEPLRKWYRTSSHSRRDS